MSLSPMRKDLRRKITEDGARGGHSVSKKRERQRTKATLRNDGIDTELPHRGKQKRRAKYSWECKVPGGANLNPLYRVLEKQVGRPWNDVYSDFCRLYPQTNKMNIQLHQYLHGWRAVERNVEIDEDGQPRAKEGHWRQRGSLVSSGSLYIDPHDGILKQVPRSGPTGRRPKTVAEKIEAGETVHFLLNRTPYYFHESIFYELIIEPVQAFELPRTNERYPTFTYRSPDLKKVGDYWEASGWMSVEYCPSTEGSKDIFLGSPQSYSLWSSDSIPQFCRMRPSAIIERYGKYGVCIRKLQLSTREIRKLKKGLGLS